MNLKAQRADTFQHRSQACAKWYRQFKKQLPIMVRLTAVHFYYYRDEHFNKQPSFLMVIYYNNICYHTCNLIKTLP